MRDGQRGVWGILGLCAAVALAAGPAAAGPASVKTISAGLGYENLTRSIIWSGDTAASKIQAGLISARADVGFAKGLVLGLSAGIVMTDFKSLAFTSLPISLRYDGAPFMGFSFGAEAVAPILGFSDFEISGAGRIVYSFGMSKTWPLEGFAVDGEARGRSSWLEAAAGPRLTYRFSDRIVPFLEIAARWLRADFEMIETLGDLDGAETKRVRGDLSFSVSLGADAALSSRIGVKFRAGFLPYDGGVDSLVSFGLMYRF